MLRYIWYVCKDHLDEYESRKRSDACTATEAHIQDIMKALKKVRCIKQIPTHLYETLNKGPHWLVHALKYE